MHCDPRRRAFTLVELMVSIGLAIMVVAVAYSGFRAATQAMRLSAQMTMRNSLLAGYLAYSCDLADNWTAMDPTVAEGNPSLALGNFRVRRQVLSGYRAADHRLPAEWPQPRISISTTIAPAPIYSFSSIDCMQLPFSHWSSSSMVPNWHWTPVAAWFPTSPFGRDKPNVDAGLYRLISMDGNFASTFYRTAWFGALDTSGGQGHSDGVNGALWNGQSFGRRLTGRKTSACTIELIDPETGSTQTFPFQITGADQWN